MPMFDCEVCGATPVDGGTAVFRVNEKGIPGIWRCREHLRGVVPEEVDDIVSAFERAAPPDGEEASCGTD